MIFTDPEFWRRLSDAITEERGRRCEALELGRVPMGDYREAVGFLSGLRWVSDTALEIMRSMNEGDARSQKRNARSVQEE